MMQLAHVPRLTLCNLPTPLVEASNLGRLLGGPRIFFKRDDETGLAAGGNKARKLEFIMADAVAKGADVAIASGSIGSNYVRMAAAAARKLGMESVSVIIGELPNRVSGNLLLDQIFDSEVILVNEPTQAFLTRNAANPTLMEDILASIAEEKRREGKNPYVLPGGGFGPLGAAGYMTAAAEISRQCYDLGISLDYAVIAAGSGSTMAGLLLGSKLLNLGMKVIGIDISRLRTLPALRARIVDAANSAALHYSLPGRVDDEDVELHDHAGKGYPIPSPEAYEAMATVARTEGVLLDPVYTAKAMAGFLDLVRRGRFEKGENVMFVHTGGLPALFSEDGLLENVRARPIRILEV